MAVIGTSTVQFDADLTKLLAAIDKAKQGIDALSKQSATVSVGGGGSTSSSNSVLQLQRAQASLEQQQARLARSQGDTARAAELEAQAEQRLQGILSQQNVTTTQTSK
jgi:hypothetical protein